MIENCEVFRVLGLLPAILLRGKASMKVKEKRLSDCAAAWDKWSL